MSTRSGCNEEVWCGKLKCDDNRKRLSHVNRDINICVKNTHFKHNCVQKYKWHRTGKDFNIKS